MKIENLAMAIRAITVIIAIEGIIMLELIALSIGINGVALTTAIACIAGLGGYEMGNIIKVFKGGKISSVTSVTLNEKLGLGGEK